jgi:hypothetical protein
MNGNYTLCAMSHNKIQQILQIVVYLYACIVTLSKNDCKLDFKTDDITNSDWRDRMILSILSIKPTNDKEINNNDNVTLSAINKKWNNKQKNIARASAWSMNLIINKDYKANKDDKMDCNDDCNGGLDCKNKRVQKCLWKKVEVRHKIMIRVAAFLQWRTLTKMTMS